MVISYHFFHPAEFSSAQAANFVSAFDARTFPEADLIAIDIESTGGWDQVEAVTAVDRIFHLVSAIKAAIPGTKDEHFIIYLSLGWARAQLGGQLSRLTAWRLWHADYAPTEADCSPWTGDQRLIWQNSEFGTVPGAGQGDVDTDVWVGPWPLES